MTVAALLRHTFPWEIAPGVARDDDLVGDQHQPVAAVPAQAQQPAAGDPTPRRPQPDA